MASAGRARENRIGRLTLRSEAFSMPLSGYFDKNRPDLKMPRTETGTDSPGVSYEGPGLSGLLGVKQQLQRQSASGGPRYAKRT